MTSDNSSSGSERVTTDIGTAVIEHPRYLTNRITDRRHDMTELSEDGYCRRFMALEYAANRPDHVNLASSPVLSFDRERWEYREKNGHHVLVKREPENELDGAVLDRPLHTDNGRSGGGS